LKSQDFAHERHETSEKKEELFLILFSFSFLSCVWWAEKIVFKQLLRRGGREESSRGFSEDAENGWTTCAENRCFG
jgi:hypothetical protein